MLRLCWQDHSTDDSLVKDPNNRRHVEFFSMIAGQWNKQLSTIPAYSFFSTSFFSFPISSFTLFFSLFFFKKINFYSFLYHSLPLLGKSFNSKFCWFLWHDAFLSLQRGPFQGRCKMLDCTTEPLKNSKISSAFHPKHFKLDFLPEICKYFWNI